MPEATPASTINWFVIVLVAATTVSLLSRRFRLPYTVALVILGFVIGYSHMLAGLSLSREIILLVFLPPLLFEGTLSMDLGMLKDNWREVSILALGVTALSFLIVGSAAHFVFGYTWPYALLIGAILSPTDPVSVLAIMRQAGVKRRLSLLIEAESCFNDGIGVVLFLIVLEMLGGHSISPTHIFWLFTREAAGGLLVGAVLGYAVHNLLSRLDDHLTETMISLALAYGAYALADHLHVSGIMAVIAAGLIIGNYGKVMAMSPRTRLALSAFWEFMAFLANSILFLLMGVALQTASLWSFAGRIVFVFLALTVSRQLLVYAAAVVMRLWGRPLPPAWDHAIGWSGLRGSIPIALALGAASTLGSHSVPAVEELVSLIFGVVLLSLLVQGLTIQPLLQRLRLSHRSEEEEAFERQVGRRIALQSASARLEEMSASGQVPERLYQEVRQSLQERIDGLQREIGEYLRLHPDLARTRRDEVERALVLAQRAALEQALQRGLIGEEVYRALQGELLAEAEERSLGEERDERRDVASHAAQE